MKIACVILGTRGDVQPMIALATGLIKKGHDVTIFAPPENEELVMRYNCSPRRSGIPFYANRIYAAPSKNNLPETNSRDILYVDEMPFEFLFPRLAAIIYHGGTGTLAAVARAGIPQAAFPFMGDQFENQKQIVKLGLGPVTCDFKKMTAESISSAISECITNDTFKKNAADMSQRLKDANGIDLTVQLIEKILYP